MIDYQIRRVNFGRHLQKWRMSQGLTQRDIATVLRHKSPQFVSTWERGLAYPPLSTITPLARMLCIGRELLVNVLFECRKAELRAEKQKWLTRA